MQRMHAVCKEFHMTKKENRANCSFALWGFAMLGLSTVVLLVVGVSTACGVRHQFLHDADRQTRDDLAVAFLAHGMLLSRGGSI